MELSAKASKYFSVDNKRIRHNLSEILHNRSQPCHSDATSVWSYRSPLDPIN